VTGRWSNRHSGFTIVFAKDPVTAGSRKWKSAAEKPGPDNSADYFPVAGKCPGPPDAIAPDFFRLEPVRAGKFFGRVLVAAKKIPGATRSKKIFPVVFCREDYQERCLTVPVCSGRDRRRKPSQGIRPLLSIIHVHPSTPALLYKGSGWGRL